MATDGGDETKGHWEDRTLTVPDVMRVLRRLFIPLTLSTIGVHLLIWGWPRLTPAAWIAATLWMLGAYLVAVIVHEALHVLPMMLAGVRLRELRFGVRWSEGVVFVHADRDLTARAYRAVLALPGVVLGLVPAVWGLATGDAFSTVFGWLMLVSAVGDWAILRLIADLDPADRVRDHHSAVGCLVSRAVA